jgi:hypothetical protein
MDSQDHRDSGKLVSVPVTRHSVLAGMAAAASTGSREQGTASRPPTKLTSS